MYNSKHSLKIVEMYLPNIMWPILQYLRYIYRQYNTALGNK